MRHQLRRDLPGQGFFKTAPHIYPRQLVGLAARIGPQFPALPRQIRASESACELTDTNSPAAIDMAPATSPERPAINTLSRDECALATPMIKLAVESSPSLAPSNAARSHPKRATE